MRADLRLALAALCLVSVGSGCSRNDCAQSMYGEPSSQAGNPAPSPAKNAGTAAPAAVDATRAVTEADIVQLDPAENRLYAMSKSGSLAVVDTSRPGKLGLLGKTTLSGEPFEMYRRGTVLLTMANNGVARDGSIVPPLPEGATAPTTAPDPKGSALISAVDLSDPANARTIATFKVAGEIADSRVVGNILYLATYENAQCWSCGTKPRTIVTTFDISAPLTPVVVDQVTFESPNGGVFNAAWSTPWKRSIVATSERLYVGGLSSDATNTNEGVIEVLDITDPAGHLARGAKITTSGPIMSRWQMDESGGVLRVVSQHGAGSTQNGDKFPDIDTFRIESTSSFLRVGHTTMTLPRQEGLKTVRFDGTRAYAITFNQTDPLFTLDLSDPANPAQKGELHMPGWMYYLEPHGDRVLGLGLDRNDTKGNLNVSLFDVSDMSAPKLVQRVPFGPTNMYEDYMITNGVMAEDQDRIQKAFKVFDDGLIAIPFSGGGSYYGDATCNGQGSGVQLLDWTSTSLTKHAFLPVVGNARRALRHDSATMKELIAISDSNISSFAVDQRDTVVQNADLTIGKCVPRTTPSGMGGFNEGGGGGYGYGADYGYSEGNDSFGWGGGMCR